MNRRILFALAAAAPLAAGCAERLDAPLSPTFGQAVASMDSQIIPPSPKTDRPPETSAARGVLAIRRYESGRPTPLQSAATSAQGGDANPASAPSPPEPPPPSPP